MAVLDATFGGCSRFHPLTFTAADYGNRPLGEHTTCRHLTVGGPLAEVGPWYPRCLLGGPPDFRLLGVHREA